jgi:hypothetical protein
MIFYFPRFSTCSRFLWHIYIFKVSNTPSGQGTETGIHFLLAYKNGMIAIFSENPHLPYLSNDRLPILGKFKLPFAKLYCKVFVYK